ncbi:MAG: hypothetical protein ABI778_08415, partial [Ignavibacteriota bacterium]
MKTLKKSLTKAQHTLFIRFSSRDLIPAEPNVSDGVYFNRIDTISRENYFIVKILLLEKIKKLIFTFLFVFLSVSALFAQWQSIAPGLIGAGQYGNGGAMGTAGGIAWAGLHSLYKSTDRGLSWQVVSLNSANNLIIQYISFFDANTGLVCTDDGLFVTHDQGVSWTKFFNGDLIFAGVFSGSPDRFVVGNATNHSACFTINGGIFWINTVLDNVVKDFYSPEPGTVMGFVETQNSSYVAITKDYGKTWNKLAGTMEA